MVARLGECGKLGAVCHLDLSLARTVRSQVYTRRTLRSSSSERNEVRQLARRRGVMGKRGKTPSERGSAYLPERSSEVPFGSSDLPGGDAEPEFRQACGLSVGPPPPPTRGFVGGGGGDFSGMRWR